MSWVATAIVITSAVLQQKAQKKAARRATLQAEKDAASARKAELFAETEGKGIGETGQISLEVDSDVIDEEENLRQGSTVRI